MPPARPPPHRAPLTFGALDSSSTLRRQQDAHVHPPDVLLAEHHSPSSGVACSQCAGIQAPRVARPWPYTHRAESPKRQKPFAPPLVPSPMPRALHPPPTFPAPPTLLMTHAAHAHPGHTPTPPPSPPWCCRCNQAGEDQRAVWRDITHRIGESLRELERSAPPNRDQVKGGAAQHNAERHRRSEGALPEGRPGEEDE